MYVSILIPLYNGVEFLNEAIISIRNQTYQNWEVIIGINGHPKSSDVYFQAKLHENKKIRVIEYNTQGKPNTLNKMVEDASYNIICLLDVDDKWLPTKLEKQIALKSKYDVIGTACKYFGTRNDIPDIPLGKIDTRFIFRVNPIINSSCMINKKDAIWNNEFIEDYDMWFRLVFEKKTFYNIPEVLTLHRIHPQSHFNNTNNQALPLLITKWKKKFGV